MASAHAKAVIAREMPDMKVVEDATIRSPRRSKSSADAVSANVGASRRRYGGRAYAGDGRVYRTKKGRRKDDSEMVVVEPKSASQHSRRSSRLTVIIRGDKVITAQG
ncbi:MAG TPA: hypothetical protein VIW07_18030 [Candidatus Udaeobacter sp.]|jgi:hypothetical protein